MNTTKCKYCPAQVIFVRSATTQQWVVLDVEPNPAGNTVIVDDKAVVAHGGLFEPDLSHLPTYMSHWATCAGRERARKDADAKKGKK